MNNIVKPSTIELEILKLISKGYSNQKIADILICHISVITRLNQILFLKLSAKNRAHAVAIGFLEGLL